MPESAGAKAAAFDATVEVVENDPVAEAERRLKRARSAVVQTQRVLDDLLEGQERADAGAAEYAEIVKAKQQEVKHMVTAAKAAAKAAREALKAEEG